MMMWLLLLVLFVLVVGLLVAVIVDGKRSCFFSSSTESCVLPSCTSCKPSRQNCESVVPCEPEPECEPELPCEPDPCAALEPCQRNKKCNKKCKSKCKSKCKQKRCQCPTGATGAAGAPGLSGTASNTGATGPAGALGGIGATGATGAIGPAGTAANTGATGGAGATGATGAPGAAGVALGFTEFFALMPGDNAATVAINSAVQFPQNGPTSGIATRQGGVSPSVFVLGAIGTYLVQWQVSFDEAGQLAIRQNGLLVARSVVGRATGTNQAVGFCMITTVAPGETIEIINGASPAAITITPSAGGTNAVSAHVDILRLA